MNLCDHRALKKPSLVSGPRSRVAPFGLWQLSGMKFGCQQVWVSTGMLGRVKPASLSVAMAGKKPDIPSTGRFGVALRYNRNFGASPLSAASLMFGVVDHRSVCHSHEFVGHLVCKCFTWVERVISRAVTDHEYRIKHPLFIYIASERDHGTLVKVLQALLALGKLAAVRINEAVAEDEQIGDVQTQKGVYRPAVWLAVTVGLFLGPEFPDADQFSSSACRVTQPRRVEIQGDEGQ